jgi:tRNA U34 5-methylaminomethyl-2-thiouridine-forming methyltransferase MnmC
MTLEVVQTEDGSITCRDAGTGELYHNRAGAYTEALRNYVEPSNLRNTLGGRKELNVLDVCFGLGYNTFVLTIELLKALKAIGASQVFKLKVVAIDRDPNIIAILPKVLADERLQPLARLAQDFENRNSAVRQALTFQCRLGKLLDFDLVIKLVELRQEVQNLVRQGEQFDLIFHDGFSAKHMPELWTYELFAQYAHLIGEQGTILTYSSAAAVRGALRLCGLTVKRTAKVGGKSGGTIAGKLHTLKDNPFAFPLTDLEEARLNSRSAIPYRDPELDDQPKRIVARRSEEINASNLSTFKMEN